jgi:hypothetical protein
MSRIHLIISCHGWKNSLPAFFSFRYLKNSSNRSEGQYKEQKAIDENGGLENLDYKRNEVTPERMKELNKTH